MTRQLFLLGGSKAFDVTSNKFVSVAGGRNGRIALLLQGGSNWQKYVPEYVLPWKKHGVTNYSVIVPDENGKLNLDNASARINNATAIFIGGGHTATYRRLYATEPIRSILRQRYTDGIPIAGCSAGALITPEICAFHPGENDDGALFAEGLGLVNDILVGVHFTSHDIMPTLLAAMTASRTARAYGVDDTACIIFEDEQLSCVLGKSAYQITLKNFENRIYESIELL